jgi:glyoxylase-like metal-dependent hydrolase (beta-lactamase superfamily II)/rhodanese-related sulfurtransferase
VRVKGLRSHRDNDEHQQHRHFKKASGGRWYGGLAVVFHQRVDEDLGCASYLIGDEKRGEAVVVDPSYAIEPYLEDAERLGLRIVRVLETHTHADHLSGHGRLALEHGLPVSIHPLAEPEYPFDPVEDGDEVRVGDLSIRVIHTPGHRPEHCCYLADGHLLTGDSLLIGDAARPDLAVEAREGAEGLYHSLQRLVELPESTEVDPGHVAGSLCATGISSALSSTIGFERISNRALSYHDLQEFVAATATVSAPRPPTVERVVALNRGPFVGASPPLEPLAAFDGQVLDVRSPHEFASGHVAGALNVPVEGSSLGTKAGFLLDAEQSIAIHASSLEEADTAAARLRAVGLLDLAGFLTAPTATERMEPIELDELERLLAADAVEVIDVREKNERDEGYIPGSRNIPYRLVGSYADELANGRPVVTVCESGARAGVAASVLAARGVEARPLLDGGVPDWEARGNAITSFRRCGSS